MISLLPTQREFFREAMRGDTKTISWFASIGAGKTFGIAYTLIMYALEFTSHHSFIIAGHSVGNVKKITVPEMEKVARAFELPVKRVFSGDQQYISIADRKFYIFGGADIASKDRLHGLNVSASYVDEVTTLNEEFWVTLLGRNRVSHGKFKPKVFVSGNKSGQYHWARDLIADNPEITHFESFLDENIHLGDQVSQLKRDHVGTGHMEKRLIMNQWADATGLVYDKFTKKEGPDRGIIDDSRSKFVIGLDWGMAGVTGAVLLQSIPTAPNVITWNIADEYYHNARLNGQLSDRAHIHNIREKFTEQVFRQAKTYIDPSAVSMKAELVNQKYTVYNANNDIEKGITTCQRAFRDGKVTVNGDNREWLREVSRYTWRETTMDGKDKPVKTEDHLMDATRYAVMGAAPIVSFAPVDMRRLY